MLVIGMINALPIVREKYIISLKIKRGCINTATYLYIPLKEFL